MKKELKDGYTVVYRSGTARVVKGDGLYCVNARVNNLDRYNDQLSETENINDYDIVSIRNENHVEIWKRVNEEWVDR